MKGLAAVHAVATTLAGKTGNTVNIPTPSLPHINWYVVGACLIVAAFLMSFFKKNKLAVMFFLGAIATVALKIHSLKGH